MPEEYSNQTLHEILIRIENKVDKTNGRVCALEAWRNRLIGAYGALAVICGGLFTMILSSLF